MPTISRMLCGGLAASLLAHAAASQSCWHQGSVAVPAVTTFGPVLLACPGAPTWPSWELFTPAHRAPAPHLGFNPGTARALPQTLVVYTCTGLLLAPVARGPLAAYGYVIDRAEFACAPTM